MKIAIRGHKSRGKEVIQILESLGGVNRCPLKGNSTTSHYYINYDSNNTISCHNFKYVNEHCKTYTLEEFEKEFPFKVGDEVTIIGLPNYPKVITKMTWMNNEIFYTFGDDTWYNTGSLRKLEMKEERNITLTLDKAKEWYKKGEELREIALQAFTEEELIKVELPKTWEEFCKNYHVKKGESYLGPKDIIGTVPSDVYGDRVYKNWIPSKELAEAHLALIQLEQLRNCWWNGWKPIWDCSEKWCIRLWGNELSIGITTNISRFLTFPTKEMAEEFLKCFKDLIEQAGDLI